MVRDFTKAQFRAAARRNGFKLGVFGLMIESPDGAASIEYGYLFQARPFKIFRRDSLAKAIRERQRDKEKAERVARMTVNDSPLDDSDLALARQFLSAVNRELKS